MKSYFAYFHQPGKEPVESTVLVFDKNLSIGFRSPDGSNAMINWLLNDVESSFDFSGQQTKLRHLKTPGAELFIKGNDAAGFIEELKAEQKKAWHKKSGGKEWIRNSLLLFGMLGLLFLLYLLIVPWLSQKLASKVSIKTEKQLGDAVYDALGLAGQEDTAKSTVLNEFFTAMDVPTAYNIKISVVNDNVVNAFALPGGRIIVYSALLKEITSYPELAALLSHEFTHINNKHSTKSIFRRLGSKVFLGLLFGRLSTVTTVVVNHADNLKSLKYSRSLEILTKREIDPNGFVSLFHHLGESAPAKLMPEFLVSHPDVEKRIAYIQEASRGIRVTENLQLKAIFDKLK
jgi:Zn-dependent protease with chaperone function